MDGISTLHSPRQPWRLRVFLGLLLVLCLAYAHSVLSADIFSVIFASAPGYDQVSKGNVVVDYSNDDKGYIMIKHAGSKKRLKVIVTYQDGTENRYDLSNKGEYEAYPLHFGSGSYKVMVLEHKKNSEYTPVFSTTINANVPDKNAAFLSPNQQVWYTASTKAVAKSFELCEGLNTDREKAVAIYDYVCNQVVYDWAKAATIPSSSGYLPDVDETLSSRMGICYDKSALVACMLRVQGIPTKMMIGNVINAKTNIYHAWNLVLLDGQWNLMDATLYYDMPAIGDYIIERYY